MSLSELDEAKDGNLRWVSLKRVSGRKMKMKMKMKMKKWVLEIDEKGV